MKLVLLLTLLLCFSLVQAQDFATAGVPTTITTACIQNGTVNASGATIIIYNMTGATILPFTNEYQIAQGLFGANITFNNTGKYITRETCNFTAYSVQGSEFIIVTNPTSNASQDLIPLLNSMSAVDNETNMIVKQINSTSNQLQLSLAQVNNTVNSIETTVENVQDDVNDLQTSVDQIKNNLTFLIDLHLNQSMTNLSNISAQLNAIQSTINNHTISLLQINQTSNIILGNLTQHIQEDNLTEEQMLSYLQNITLNLTTIAGVLNSISINISGQNLTAINDSITGLITAVNAPRTYSLTVILLILLLIMLIVSIWYHPPIFLFLTGALAVMTGFTLIATVGLWILFIFIGLGFTYIIWGLKRM